ncbi:MAG: hypothetical protein JWO86_4451 [Myxococcaceae bacterium]|nr:hypothetical protein [Myxococcaceae bacterium]
MNAAGVAPRVLGLLGLLGLVSLLAMIGCGASPPPRASTPSYSLPSLPARPSFDANAGPPATGADSSYRFSADDALAGGVIYASESTALAGAPAVRRAGNVVNQAMAKITPGRAVASTGTPTARSVALPGTEAAKEEEKIEREAQLAVEVKSVSEAAGRVLALVRVHDGTVTKDERASGTQSTASLVIRIPSDHFDAFLAEVATVGEIRNRSIKAVDSGLEHKDLGILVDNLEAALARYRDLLQKATDPLQILAVERELERVRSDLDRIKGRLTFLRDRVARATIAIALHSPEAPSDQLPFARKPQISSGVRALSFVDVRESGTNGYVGSGLTLRLPSSGGETARGLILDVDVMRACCKSRPDRSSWAYDILLGFDLYSDALQAGRRRWLNPYLGARVGFSQTQDRGDFAAAGVFGLEIFKTSALMIDVQARAMALVGNPDGPHAGIQPSLGFDLGF